MSDWYLRAETPAILLTALRAAGMTVTTADGEAIVTVSHDHALDVIGVLFTNPTPDAPAKALEGWHANLRWLSSAPLPTPLIDLVIPAPAEPLRRWA
jgi:hypothetical protein